MKNSVLGKIIIESGQIADLTNQIKMLEQKLTQTKDLAQISQIGASIQKLKNRINQIRGDIKRSELIGKIEGLTKRKLITYFSIHGSISDRDSRIIEDFLISNKISEFDILIDSPGGQTDAAEKMIKICRIRTGNDNEFDFRTIVVNQAKSAATLFALGSSKILLSKTAELGPVDPQIMVYAPNGDKIRDSAHQIYYGSQKYLDNSNRLLNFRKDGDLLLLSKYDPIAIKRAEVAINHTNDIISKRIYTNPYLLQSYKKSKNIEEELKIFTKHEESHSHGRPIYFEDISKYGYCQNKFIQKLDDYYLNDEGLSEENVDILEDLLSELTIRSLEVVRSNSEPIIDNNGKNIGFNQVALKLFESSDGLILTKDILN